MNQQQAELEVGVVKNIGALEEAIRVLWEKVKSAGDLVTQLRTERQSLTNRVAAFEREVSMLRTEIQNKEQELKRLKMEHAQLLSSNDSGVFSSGEKEILKSRIKDFIAKISSHL